MNYSHTTIVGRLGGDPEYKEVGDGLWKFSVAVTRSWKAKGASGWTEETDWYNCDCWGEFGARTCKGLKKGALVVVDGEMQSRKHEGTVYWSLRPNKVRRLEKLDRQATGGGGDIDDEPDDSPLPF